jgi:TonB family protein
MPLKTFKVFISFLFILTISNISFAQGEPERMTLAELKADPPKAPTSAEIMRSRISKAKAYLVIKNFGAAIYELENIRRETNDQSVHHVLNVLLMHAYLEQGDYIKAQKFLKEMHNSKSPTAAMDYLAVAGQVVSGAKTLHERYKSLGLDVSDRNLPTEAATDVENMRKTLELVVEQSKTLSQNKQYTANAFALLEESSSARGNLAKDVYDQKRWKDQVSDARELLVNPNSKIINAVNNPPIEPPSPNIVAATDLDKTDDVTATEDTADDIVETDETDETETAAFKPVEEEKPAVKTEEPKTAKPAATPAETNVAKNDPEKKETNDGVLPADRRVRIIGSAEKTDEEKADTKEKQPNVKSEEQPQKAKIPAADSVAANENGPVDKSPLAVGPLIGYATKRVNPVYPSQARNMRMTGTVKVEVVIDEDGNVAEIENTEGPALLKRAASDAVRKWQFRPFERDGRPVKATGFISFNFDL